MSFKHPFPAIRPAITIAESDEKIPQIDHPELQWWPIIPALGNRSMQATYEADTLELSEVTEMVATSPARVHQLDCVEIAVQEQTMREDMKMPSQLLCFYAALDQEKTRWLAIVRLEGDRKALLTFHDEHFEANWGQGELRLMRDDGRYQRQPDGSYRTTDLKGIGAGSYDVTIGAKTFHCLRVWDTGGPPSEHEELSEAYIEPGGRVVLFREYWGRQMGKGDTDWAEKYPDNIQIVIDGCVYVHCDCTGRAHDWITNTALGVDLA